MGKKLEAAGDYLTKLFVTVPELTEGANRLNAFTKGILDLLRNAVVVGGLQFLAEKSQSDLMRIIAIIGMCALFGYCTSYTRFVFRPFHALKNQKLAAALDRILDRILFLAISIVVVLVVSLCVQQLSAVPFK